MNASLIKFDLLSEDVCNALTQEMLLQNKTVAWEASSARSANTPTSYPRSVLGDLTRSKYKPSDMFNDIHQRSVDRLEEYTGCKLFPTLNIGRIYQHGAVLPKHLDRAAAEYSCGITLGIDSDDPAYRWPLNYSVDDESMLETFDVGEAYIIRGSKTPHWREPFEGNWQLQGMMFFVDAGGEYSHLRDDNNSERRVRWPRPRIRSL